VTTAEELAWTDPTDLDGLRAALRSADPEGRLAPVGMRRIEIGPDALYLLPEVVSELARGGRAASRAAPRVALVVDPTPMRRDGDDVKEAAGRLLGGRFEVRRAVIGGGRRELHADEEDLAEAEAAVAGADCVVVVGSGTITDVCKEATRRAGGSPLVVVQTAASVNAFSDDMAVLLKSGTKRTVPSRWPDALLVDLTVLAGAPPEMNLAGFGDLMSMWTAPADWYLASAVGMDDSYHPAPVGMLREGGQGLLTGAAGLRRREPEMLDRLARVLTLSGISLGVAGKTAPLSGTEHLVSHLIDMAAEGRHLHLALHGAQVAVAAVPVAAAWEAFLAEFDPSEVDADRLFPHAATLEPVVRRAFAAIDGREGSARSAGTTTVASSSGGRNFGRRWNASSKNGRSTGRSWAGWSPRRKPLAAPSRRPAPRRDSASWIPRSHRRRPLGLEELPPHARPLHRGRPALLRRSVGRRLRRAILDRARSAGGGL
jgi:glycerol-1-phosphate dehydrogenase [NAD(P)+]